jgi:hypothetical protein
MTKFENRCANCGGKFGLVCHQYWGLRFCRKACKGDFLTSGEGQGAYAKVAWMGRKKTDLPPGAINCAGTPYPDVCANMTFA